MTDGKIGAAKLTELTTSEAIFLPDWRILWIGTCTLLRSSIDLFRVDARSCINKVIRNELENEWRAIKEDPDSHRIYWQFLKRERDNIIHEYKWSVYEKWMTPEGEVPSTGPTLLGMDHDEIRSVLQMKEGPYAGNDPLQLLHEGAAWLETRICSAIERAGFSPDEERNIVSFQQRPKFSGIATTILSGG